MIRRRIGFHWRGIESGESVRKPVWILGTDTIQNHVSGVFSQEDIHGVVLKMLRAFIDDRRCLHCTECYVAKICPSKAIFKLDPEESAVIEVTYCYGCGECIEHCANTAIALKIS